MLAVKSSRKPLRLLSDEEDSLLAGMDFQTYYLGRKEIQVDNNDLDTVVEGIYSQYMDNGDINNSTQLTITVDTNQLVFRHVVTHHIEFTVALTSVKSVYCSDKKSTKFPNAVIVVCCLPSQSIATVHVLHCLNQNRAQEFYNAINRAFEYHENVTNDVSTRDKSSGTILDKSSAFSRANKDLGTNAVSVCKVNTTKSTKYQEFNVAAAKKTSKKTDAGDNENTGLLGAEEITPVKHEVAQKRVKEIAQTQAEDEVKSRSRTKSVPTKGGEGRGLLDNIDPEDGFDDEFTDLARNRSLSDNIRARFGR